MALIEWNRRNFLCKIWLYICTMLSINNLSYHIGSRTIFGNASLHIRPKDKIGLVGLNGTGKTTLLRIINGEVTPDSGDVTKSNDCAIGYLDQDLLSIDSSDSILSIAMEAFEEAVLLEKNIEALLAKIEREYVEEDVHKLSALQEKYEAIGGYTLQSKAEEILEGIGFNTSDLHRPLNEFSGGWRMRVMLAKLLLAKPELLMLDEPTNHLDLPSIIWVEQYLRNYPGAVIVVSHDKKFLDNVADTIVEVRDQDLITYQGNYSYYLRERTQRLEILKNAFQNQQQKIKQDERFIQRFRAKATKARQVQSRIKSLERMDRIEEVSEEKISVHFNFKLKTKSGRHLVHLKNVSKKYGDNILFTNANLSIERGNKIALVGANGLGKSTLLRIIAGTENYVGEKQDGYNLITAFYAQHQVEALHLNNEILDELKQTGTPKTEQELRAILGSFLFSDDDVYKKIKVLSGGEKSRVALAKTLISEANFLILDEPTNHLDIQSVNILIQALRQYEGTCIMVSHDRHFIDQVANKIWYIEDRHLKEYPGKFEEYLHWKQQNQRPELIYHIPKKSRQLKSSYRREPPEVGEANKNEIKKLQKKLAELENLIFSLEQEKDKLDQEMAKPDVYTDFNKLNEVNRQRGKTVEDLELRHNEWEKLVEKLSALESSQE